ESGLMRRPGSNVCKTRWSAFTKKKPAATPLWRAAWPPTSSSPTPNCHANWRNGRNLCKAACGALIMPQDPSIFDEIFSLLTPERLLRDPRGTGEGVVVGVIDSGVERSLLEEKFRKQNHEIHPIEGAIFRADNAAPLPYEGRQSAPHGTTVAD